MTTDLHLATRPVSSVPFLTAAEQASVELVDSLIAQVRERDERIEELSRELATALMALEAR